MAISEIEHEKPILRFAYICNFCLLILMVLSFFVNYFILGRDLRSPISQQSTEDPTNRVED